MIRLPSPLNRVLRHVDAYVRGRIAERRDGVVPFYEGRFVATANRAEFAARTFYEGGQISKITADHLDLDPPANANRAVDVGCGYGRLTPYLCDAPHINSVHGIEPDDRARTRAAGLYPFITFADGVAEDIPYPDDHFALAVAWTVLQHIPDRNIERAAAELERVIADGGYLIACDKTAGAATAVVHPRPVGHYAALFGGFELVDIRERAFEPTTERNGENSVMVFRLGES